MKRILAIGAILLFIGMSISSSTGFNVREQYNNSFTKGNTLYVGGSGPNNYTKIQDAIDNASDGDTVFVYNGTYYEHLKVDKNINLFGEDKEKTVIDAGGNETAVDIGASVNLSGFTIQNAEEGISNFIPPPPDNIYKFFVYGNIIKNNVVGCAFGASLNNIIHNNIITNNQLGINFFLADDYEVNNNNFINNEKHAYFEYVLFLQIMPRIKWNSNYWDDWNLRLPRFIRGEKVIVFVFRPGWVLKESIGPWYNFDWHPAQESYPIEV